MRRCERCAAAAETPIIAAACVTVMVTMDASWSSATAVVGGCAMVWCMVCLDMCTIQQDVRPLAQGSPPQFAYAILGDMPEQMTITHRKHRYTVTRLTPRGVADAQQVAYTVTGHASADRVPVYGHLVPAVFSVEGWRHRVTMTLDADMRRGSTDHGVYISQLVIDVGDGLGNNEPRLTSTADVRIMPVGIWLDAAAQLCAFRGTARPRNVEVKGQTIYYRQMTEVSTPRAAANGAYALTIDAVGRAARTPAKLVKTRTGRASKRVGLPPWRSDEALRMVARYWHEQTKTPAIRGGVGVAAWISLQTGYAAGTCTRQITEARRRGLLPTADRANAVKKQTTKKKRGKR